jgi:hypothetical protein
MMIFLLDPPSLAASLKEIPSLSLHRQFVKTSFEPLQPSEKFGFPERLVCATASEKTDGISASSGCSSLPSRINEDLRKVQHCPWIRDNQGSFTVSGKYIQIINP